MKLQLFCATILGLVLAYAAPAMEIDATTGAVTDWGITPFSVSGVAHGAASGLAYTLENNYSPISYPWGIGHVPSPGLSAGGKPFDLEEMYLRVVDSQLQVLLVASSPTAATLDGTTYYLGELFVEADGQCYGVVTQSASQGLAAGSVYRLQSAADVLALQSASRSYAADTHVCQNDYGPDGTVAQIAGPWAVSSSIASSQLLGSASLLTAVHDYGAGANGTHLFEYTVSLGLLGTPPPSAVTSAKITWGCGNDAIRVESSLIPEPATMALLGGGLGLIVSARFSRRRRYNMARP